MHPLDAPLHQLPRIPKAIVHAYAARDIHTVRDVLEHVPSRYVNTSIRPLTEVDDGDTVAVEAVVLQAASSQRFGGKRSRVVCAVASGTTSFQAIWFNQPYVREKLRPGIAIHITGKWQKMRKQLIVSATLWTKQDTTSAQLLPIYPSTEGLHQGRMRHWVGVALAFVGDNWVDAIPQEIVSRRRLVDVRTAYAAVHKPATRSELEMGRARCVYDEFFWYQLRMQALRVQEKKHGDGIVHTFARERVRAFVRALRFLLTASQKRAIADILDDMERPSPMNRLLQGDVGSGKTVVAAVALYACVCGGKQGALMVPTELLAQQHARNIQQLMPQQHVTLLTSGLTERQKRDIQTGLRCGAVHIVVGTHALIQEHLEFADLGLVVIDEQHRFGVKQRSVLKQKGHNPDVLAMTATPIPRTLAITAYGDRDVSVLPELPAGRIPIETKWMHPQDIDAVYALIRTHIDAKRQVYVVCPLIEQGENDLDAAIDVYTRMQQQFGEARVGLLHGKLHAREKDDTMRRFVEGVLAMLVATTVIEVGVDVPNATMIVVYNAERFGLAQLHQLRGRVGRGAYASTCIVLSDAHTDIARKRLRTFVSTTDGFALARQDLALRGPGDVFGTQQSGLPKFRIGDIEQDFPLLEAARDDASALLAEASFWTDPQYAALRDQLSRAGVPMD